MSALCGAHLRVTDAHGQQTNVKPGLTLWGRPNFKGLTLNVKQTQCISKRWLFCVLFWDWQTKKRDWRGRCLEVKKKGDACCRTSITIIHKMVNGKAVKVLWVSQRCTGDAEGARWGYWAVQSPLSAGGRREGSVNADRWACHYGLERRHTM